jgi:hypothetical protein
MNYEFFKLFKTHNSKLIKLIIHTYLNKLSIPGIIGISIFATASSSASFTLAFAIALFKTKISNLLIVLCLPIKNHQ